MVPESLEPLLSLVRSSLRLANEMVREDKPGGRSLKYAALRRRADELAALIDLIEALARKRR